MQSNSSNSEFWLDKVATLIESLPYMKQYSGLSVVIKFGGHAMGEQAFIEAFSSDIVLLRQVGAKPVVVHGGGPQIGSMLERLKMESNFIDGLRVTDQQTISIVEMVLAGAINKSLVASIASSGGMAVGISGKDGNLIKAKKLAHKTRDSDSAIENLVDLGYVGIPQKVDTQVLDALIGSGMIPVVAPLGLGVDGKTYKITGDTSDEEKQAKKESMFSDIIDDMLAEEVNVEEAEVIMAARALADDVQDMIARLGKMVNEDLPAIQDQMRAELGAEVAASFQDSMVSAVDGHLAQTKATKQSMDDAIGMLSGEAPMDSGMMADEPMPMDEPVDNMDAEVDAMAEPDAMDVNDPAAAGPEEEPLGRAPVDAPEGV